MLKRICQNWVKFEEGIDYMIAEHRQNPNNNKYCLSVRHNMKLKDLTNADAIDRIGATKNVKELARVMNGHPEGRNRYFKLNLQNLIGDGKKNTIEFRAHEGTLEPADVENWVRFLIAFVEVSAAGPEPKPFSENAGSLDVYHSMMRHFIPTHKPSLHDYYGR